MYCGDMGEDERTAVYGLGLKVSWWSIKRLKTEFSVLYDLSVLDLS